MIAVARSISSRSVPCSALDQYCKASPADAEERCKAVETGLEMHLHSVSAHHHHMERGAKPLFQEDLPN